MLSSSELTAPSGWHLNYNVRKKPSSLFRSLHTHTHPNTNRRSTWYSCSHTHTWANTHCNNYRAGCVRGSEGYRVLILWRLHRQNKEEKITRVCLEKECQCSRGPSVKHVSTKCHWAHLVLIWFPRSLNLKLSLYLSASFCHFKWNRHI